MKTIRSYFYGRKNSVILFTATFIMVILLALCVFSVSVNLYTNLMMRSQKASGLEQIEAYIQAAEANLSKLREVASYVEYSSFVRSWINTPFVSVNLMDLKNIQDNNNSVVASNPRLFSIDLYNANERKVLSTFSGYYDVDRPMMSGAARSAQLLAFAERGDHGSVFYVDTAYGKLGMVTFMKHVTATNKNGVVAVSGELDKILPTPPQGIQLYLSDEKDSGWQASVTEPGQPVAIAYRLLLKEQSGVPARTLRMANVSGNGQMHAISYPGFLNDLALHAVFPQYSAASIVMQNPNAFALVVAAICLVSLLLAWVILRLAYEPLRRMLEQTTQQEEGGPIKRLETLMQHYMRQEEALRASLEMNRTYLYERTLRDLIFGRRRLEPDARMPAIVRPFGNAFVLACMTFAPAAGKQEDERILSRAREIGETVRALAPCELLQMSPLLFVLLVNYEQKPSSGELARCLEEAVERAPDDGVHILSIGVSNVGDLVQELPELYEQALTASRTTPADSSSIVVRYNTLVRSGNQSSFWQAIRPLVQALRAGGEADVEEALATIVERHVGIAPDEREPFLLYLIAYINRVSQSFGASLHQLMDEDPFDVFSDQQTSQAQLAYIRSLCRRVLGARTDLDKQYKRASVELAIQYLKVNFDKPLSLSTLADELEISPSYLSELLKKELNMTYVKYVQMLRMNRAKELLVETTSNVKDIALVVGYDSEHSFIRNFKSVERMTPSQYRARRTKGPQTP